MTDAWNVVVAESHLSDNAGCNAMVFDMRMAARVAVKFIAMVWSVDGLVSASSPSRLPSSNGSRLSMALIIAYLVPTFRRAEFDPN